MAMIGKNHDTADGEKKHMYNTLNSVIKSQEMH